MAHTRAARYLRKRLRSLLRRLTPCCVRSQPPDGVGRPAAGQEPWDPPSLRPEEIIASSPEKGKEKTVDVVRDHGDREQLLASFVANYVKEIIFNARVKLYIEDMIIKGSLAIIESMLPANDDKIS